MEGRFGRESCLSRLLQSLGEKLIMAHRNIIVVGASLGGVEALPRLAAQLPRDLEAAVLVVMHMSPNAPSYLAPRLDAEGPLRAAAAVDGEEIVPGRIYVAVPDHHLAIDEHRIRLTRGPRESHARPSVDVLFRSAAYHHGPRVIGVVLTGLLDDGTAGLWSIKDCGGVAIVQSPAEALQPSMPSSALRHVDVDHTLAIAEMPDILHSLTREKLSEPEPRAMSNRNLAIETRIALGENALQHGVRAIGTPSFYTCPECYGSMIAIEDGSFRRFRCHTGHGFTPAALAQEGLARVEQTLWSALAQLEEHEVLLSELEKEARERARLEEAARYAAQATEARHLAARVRTLALAPALEGHDGESADPAHS
jgi:two-component system chemotaxis response regulator CheB